MNKTRNLIPSMVMDTIFILCALIFSFMAIKILIKKTRASPSLEKLPPGPKKLPILGNIHQVYSPLPHHTLRDLAKKYGPLMHLQLGEISTVIVSSPEFAKEICTTHDNIFSERARLPAASVFSYNFVDIVFSPYGDYWRQMRKICTMELLSQNRVQTFRSIREEEVLNIINSIALQTGSSVNLSRKIFSLTYGITAKAAFGEKCKHQEQFLLLVTELIKLFGGFSLVDLYPSSKLLDKVIGMRRKIEKVHKQIDAILQNIVNEHRKKILKQEPGSGEAKDDLVDILLNIERRRDNEPPFTDINIKAVIHDIFSAGSDTSSTTVEWAISEMIRNPKVMKKAQDEVRNLFDERGNVEESSLQELKYLQAVIKETMRLHPSLPLLLPKESNKRCEIKGYEIPAKTRVFVNAWAIGRDPMYWTEAEKFNPERFLDSEIDYKGNHFHYIPFGAGKRICPGILFALPNIALPLAQLLFHFDWKLPGEMQQEELDMTEAFGLTVRRKNDLQLIPILHNHSSLKKDL